MTFVDALILAQTAGERTAERSDNGPGAGIIAIVVLGVILIAVAIFTVFHRSTKASKGGVEPLEGEFERGAPPVEGVRRQTTP